MSQFQPQEKYDDDYYEYDDYDHKRKRLSQVDNYPYPAPQPQRHPIVEIVAWSFVGGIGLALTVGATIAITQEPVGDEWVILVPLVYMVAAMYWMRRR